MKAKISSKESNNYVCGSVSKLSTFWLSKQETLILNPVVLFFGLFLFP
jgi:hypothetical protein